MVVGRARWAYDGILLKRYRNSDWCVFGPTLGGRVSSLVVTQGAGS